MSHITRQKHYKMEEMNEDVDLKENQQIVKVIMPKGNNLHEAENTEGETFLISMPSKFRKNIWIKRGDFVIIDPISEGDKVKGEIVKILTQYHIKELTKLGKWPEKFIKNKQSKRMSDKDENEDGFEVKNLNKPQVDEESFSSSSSSDNADSDGADDERTS